MVGTPNSFFLPLFLGHWEVRRPPPPCHETLLRQEVTLTWTETLSRAKLNGSFISFFICLRYAGIVSETSCKMCFLTPSDRGMKWNQKNCMGHIASHMATQRHKTTHKCFYQVILAEIFVPTSHFQKLFFFMLCTEHPIFKCVHTVPLSSHCIFS